MPTLAINGGKKLRTKLFPNQNTIDKKEIAAANRVLKSGNLTGYKGNAGEGFYGGPEIQALEKEWEAAFNTKKEKLYCIPINSCTSGLFVACGTLGLKPGDEVIVTPYSMTCSATAPMIWGATPVFADIDPETFNLDPEDVQRKITSRTKAIIVVDLFGHPYNKKIDIIAAKHGLTVIEDAAQAVDAKRGMSYTGTLGHIGVFSFNLGKHLTSGEGGMICTYNSHLAYKCRLLINHAEAVVNDFDSHDTKTIKNVSGHIQALHFSNMYGFNLRLTEINAAIVRAQLVKKNTLIKKRIQNVHNLINFINDSLFPAIKFNNPKANIRHTYYALPLIFNEAAWGVHRNIVVNAVKAELMPCAGREDEGVTISSGYIKPIWRMPIFRETYGHTYDDRFPETSPTPVCDRMYKKELILLHRFFGPNAEEGDMQFVVGAFEKVWRNRRELK